MADLIAYAFAWIVFFPVMTVATIKEGIEYRIDYCQKHEMVEKCLHPNTKVCGWEENGIPQYCEVKKEVK